MNPTGGKKILARMGGKDASKQFWKYHNEDVLKKYQKQLQIGSLDTKPKPDPPAAAPKPVKKTAEVVVKQTSSEDDDEALDPFGAQIPFADPSWYQSVSSFHSTHGLRRVRRLSLTFCFCPFSTTRLISTSRMRPSVLRSGNGWTRPYSRM